MLKCENIYLDYQASTPLSQKASEAIHNVLLNNFANPHSTDHAEGWRASKIVEDASHTIAELIGALEDEIIFVSGATEANNLAIIGTGLTAHKEEHHRKKIIISEIEHKSVIGAARFLEEFFEYEVVKAEVNEDGIINIEQLNKIVDKNTLLVSIMAVNSEIGTYQPLEGIAKICREHNVIFHVDAAQALYFDIDVVQQGIDLLSLSSHKMYGPKGIGALYVNQLLHIRPTPLFHGGNQQNSYRSGTIPTELTAGFAAAIQELTSVRKNEIIHLKSLRNHAWNILKELFPDIKVNGNWNKRHPGNINVTFPGVDAKSLIGSLQPSIAISTGSACSSGIPEPSHVLKAIGLSTEDAESTIRISLGRSTNKTEIEKAMRQIAKEANTYKKEFCRNHIDPSPHE